LQVLVAETTIEENKVAAIRNKTSGSRVVEIARWLAGTS
jgi:hypothetical protein